MADNKITQTNSRFLYETATSTDPLTWTVIAEGYTWSDSNRLFRVTADEAQFDTTAYVLQKTNSGGNYEDAFTITLNVPDGDGLSRVDVFSSVTVTGSPDYTIVSSLDTYGRVSELDRIAHEQQVDLEQNGIGAIFDYGGSKYRGTLTSRTDSKEFEPGGYLEGFELYITTSRKQWSDAGVVPFVGAHVIIANTKYRIEQIIKNNAHYQLNLTKKRGG